MTDPDRSWFLGVQWHPEDTADSDVAQQTVFTEFIAASQRFVHAGAAS
jgi:putative glutamine amidotransferase